MSPSCETCSEQAPELEVLRPNSAKKFDGVSADLAEIPRQAHELLRQRANGDLNLALAEHDLDLSRIASRLLGPLRLGASGRMCLSFDGPKAVCIDLLRILPQAELTSLVGASCRRAIVD